jgi:hypothetical protein
MYRFEKDSEYALFTGDNVKLSFAYMVKKMDDTFYVNIPSLNIHFYTKDIEQIPESTQESLESYFNYWYTIRNIEFLEHMLNLGFTVRSGKTKRRDSKLKPLVGRRRKLNDEFQLSK